MGNTKVKPCIRCGAADRNSDGRCKPCDVARRAAYRADNPADTEKERARVAAYRAANPEKTAEYRAANSEKIAAGAAAWRAANPDKLRAKSSMQRARKRTTQVDKINPYDIFERDGWACYMCLVTCIPGVKPRTRFAAELEHVVPLSRGGTHTADNLACACYPCNKAKGVRPANYVPDLIQHMLYG